MGGEVEDIEEKSYERRAKKHTRNICLDGVSYELICKIKEKLGGGISQQMHTRGHLSKKQKK